MQRYKKLLIVQISGISLCKFQEYNYALLRSFIVQKSDISFVLIVLNLFFIDFLPGELGSAIGVH